MSVSSKTSSGASNEVMTVSTGCWTRGCRYNILSTEGQRYQISKILMLTLIPIIALSVVTSLSVRDKTDQLKIKDVIQKGIKFSLETGFLLRSTQIERGMSTLYLSSRSDNTVFETLLEKYRATDTIINHLSNWPTSGVGDPPHFESKIAYFESIKRYRNKVMSNNVTTEETIRKYSDDNSVIISWVAASIRLYTTGDLWMTLVAYHMLLLASDEVGVERALGSTFFTTETFSTEQLAWYIEKKVTAKHFMVLSSLYSDEVRQLLESNLLNSKLSRSLDDMRQVITSGKGNPMSAITPIVWFDNMTTYIDIIKDIQDRVGQNILITLQQELEEVSLSYKLSIGLLTGAILMYPTILIVVFKLTKQIQLVAVSFKDQASSLSKERKRSENLLCQMLPVSVAKKLMENEKVEPRLYKSATVCFSDIVGFTTICAGCTPFQVVDLLNLLYNTYDSRLEKYDVYKVETIGDAYMVVSGVPETNGELHVSEIALLALDLLDATQNLHIPELSNKTLRLSIRIGVNTGPVVSGVVGVKMPRYCLFGDTVNVASRMESTGKPQRIQLSANTVDALQKFPCFQTQERGFVEIKGKGEMRTHWLLQSSLTQSSHVRPQRPPDYATTSNMSNIFGVQDISTITMVQHV